MFKLEQELYNQLIVLKNKYNVQGIKAEFEAEGSNFNDIVRLRRITLMAGVQLHLKIGGVEAIRDIKDSLEIGVDGLIAPMVESAFGAIKFINAVERIFKNHKPILTLNIETKNAYHSINDIIKISEHKINNLTLGRSDFSRSYFPEQIHPDSNFVTNAILDIGKKINTSDMLFTIGGSITQNTANLFNKIKEIDSLVHKIETRKVIFPIEAIKQQGAIKAALQFEKLYILSKKEIYDNFIEPEVSRLTELERRI